MSMRILGGDYNTAVEVKPMPKLCGHLYAACILVSPAFTSPRFPDLSTAFKSSLNALCNGGEEEGTAQLVSSENRVTVECGRFEARQYLQPADSSLRSGFRNRPEIDITRACMTLFTPTAAKPHNLAESCRKPRI